VYFLIRVTYRESLGLPCHRMASPAFTSYHSVVWLAANKLHFFKKTSHRLLPNDKHGSPNGGGGGRQAPSWATDSVGTVFGCSLPEGMQAREILRSTDGIGKRLEVAVGYAGRLEETTLQKVPEPFEATVVLKERVKAKAEAEVEERPGLTMYTDGSRMQSGAAGY
jgi:hypothetical protein